jgi:hypothetical protein
LTQNEEVSVTKVEEDECNQPVQASNPFADQTPHKILTRQYKLAEFAISPSWVGASYDFPKELFEIPAIQKALSSFYYLRAGVTIMVKINSTVYHQGMMLMAFEGDCPNNRNWSTYQLSAMDPITLNYSTSDSATIQVAWVCPELYCTTVYNEGEAHAIGRLFLRPLVPIANTSGGTDTITCSVYAAFTDPRTAGFINQPIAQSGHERMKNPEAVQKSEDGTLAKKASPLSLKPIFESIPLIGEIYDLAETILDKPTTQQAAQKMIVDYTTDQCYGRGLDSATRLSIYPESILSTAKVMNGITSNSKWSTLAGKPMLHYIKNFTNSNDYFELGVDPMFQVESQSLTIQPDYLTYSTALFGYWRGSIKYMFQFVTNAFTTARFRISYAIDPTETNFTEGGDFPNVIVDVKGSTNYYLVVPFLAPTIYRPVSSLYLNIATSGRPKLKIELVSTLVDNAGEPIITVLTWRAAGADYQLHEERHFTADFPVTQCSIKDSFKTKFATMAQGNMSRESGVASSNYAFRISDSLKKYVRTDELDLSNFPISRDNTIISTVSAKKSTYRMMNNIFKYKRGSRRYKLFFESTATRWQGISNTPTYDAYTVGLLVPSDFTPLQTVEIPYHAAHYYLADTTDTYATFFPREGGISSFPTQVEYVFTSIGDDYQMFYLLPPPEIVSSTNKKQKTKPLKARETKNELKSSLREGKEKQDLETDQ